MGKFIVNGNRALSGSIEVSGSKNAALPLIFATVITRGVSVLHNVPEISDVAVAIELISAFGAEIKKLNGDLIIDTTDLYYARPSDALVYGGLSQNQSSVPRSAPFCGRLPHRTFLSHVPPPCHARSWNPYFAIDGIFP